MTWSKLKFQKIPLAAGGGGGEQSWGPERGAWWLWGRARHCRMELRRRSRTRKTLRYGPRALRGGQGLGGVRIQCWWKSVVGNSLGSLGFGVQELHVAAIAQRQGCPPRLRGVSPAGAPRFPDRFGVFSRLPGLVFCRFCFLELQRPRGRNFIFLSDVFLFPSGDFLNLCVPWFSRL